MLEYNYKMNPDLFQFVKKEIETWIETKQFSKLLNFVWKKLSSNQPNVFYLLEIYVFMQKII